MGVRGGAATAQKAVAGETPVAVYVGESLELAKEGYPHPVISVTPDRALSTIDLGAGDGATFHWNPGVGATSVRVVLPDGEVVTDLARRSHRLESFQLVHGHYQDSTGRIVATNASGPSSDEATLFRYWPIALSAVRSSVGAGLTFRWVWRLTCQARPFPTDWAISPEPTGDFDSHQLQRSFRGASEDDQHRRTVELHFRPPEAEERYVVTCSNQDSEGRQVLVVPVAP